MNLQLCPKCKGQGLVSRPPWVSGDVPTWTSHTTGPYVCNLCGGRKVIDAMTAAPTGPEPLTEEAVAALPEGTPVTVIWSGGNGPHDYVIAVDEHGSRYVWNGAEERMRWYNPLRFVGQERYHTRVWLAPTGPEPRTDAAVGR